MAKTSKKVSAEAEEGVVAEVSAEAPVSSERFTVKGPIERLSIDSGREETNTIVAKINELVDHYNGKL